MKKPMQAMTNLPTWAHVGLTIGAFAAQGAANNILNASYAASKFPVPYQEGQTAFSGEVIKGYYQTMIEAGTLNIYWQTQFIDFLFIFSMFAVGLLMPLLVRRLFRPKSLPYKIATAAAVLIPTGAIFDVIENLVSFVMLAQPLTFPNWIAPIYSSFAVIKFACIGLGYVAVVTALIVWVLSFIVRRRPAQLAL